MPLPLIASFSRLLIDIFMLGRKSADKTAVQTKIRVFYWRFFIYFKDFHLSTKTAVTMKAITKVSLAMLFGISNVGTEIN